MSIDAALQGLQSATESIGVDPAITHLMGRIAVLEELVRWLSLPLGENEPTFAGADGMGTLDGFPLGQAPQLHTLWHQVTGRPHLDPTIERRWEKRACGHFHVVMEER